MTSTLAVLRTPAVLRPNSHLSALLLAPVCYCFYGFIITSSTFTSFLSPSFWDSGTVVIYTSHWSRDTFSWGFLSGHTRVVGCCSPGLTVFTELLPTPPSHWLSLNCTAWQLQPRSAGRPFLSRLRHPRLSLCHNGTVMQTVQLVTMKSWHERCGYSVTWV